MPKDEIGGIDGFFDATATVFSVYGGAADGMLKVLSVCLVFVLMSQGASWMIISDRMQAIAAADGAFFGGFFGVFNRKLSTPVRMNFLSGVAGTVFLLVAMQLSGNAGAIFDVVLIISITTFLLCYLLIIPAAVKLRSVQPERPRPFRVPVSDRGFALMGSLCFFWIALGSWVAVFPGTLEALFGIDYPFCDIWGVHRGDVRGLHHRHPRASCSPSASSATSAAPRSARPRRSHRRARNSRKRRSMSTTSTACPHRHAPAGPAQRRGDRAQPRDPRRGRTDRSQHPVPAGPARRAGQGRGGRLDAPAPPGTGGCARSCSTAARAT